MDGNQYLTTNCHIETVRTVFYVWYYWLVNNGGLHIDVINLLLRMCYILSSKQVNLCNNMPVGLSKTFSYQINHEYIVNWLSFYRSALKLKIIYRKFRYSFLFLHWFQAYKSDLVFWSFKSWILWEQKMKYNWKYWLNI